MREEHRESVNGIFVIDRAYSRGYDLKFALDSRVLILDDNAQRLFTAAEVRQCVGRSSRS